MSEMPGGTVTFLFTDIEASTALWQDHPEQMQRALARHDALLRAACEGARRFAIGHCTFQVETRRCSVACALHPDAAA